MSGFGKVHFKAGETIFLAGDLADKLYIVEKGSLQLLDPLSKQPFATVVQGQSFGEQSILSHGVRSVTAVALEDAECLAINGTGLGQLLARQHPLITPLFEALLLQLHMHNTLLRYV